MTNKRKVRDTMTNYYITENERCANEEDTNAIA